MPPIDPRLGARVAFNLETPIGMDKVSYKKNLSLLIREPTKEWPHHGKPFWPSALLWPNINALMGKLHPLSLGSVGQNRELIFLPTPHP